MRVLGNEKGAALVTALMLSVLCLVIASAVLYSVMAGDKISSSQRRYHNSLAAAHGGLDIFSYEILPRVFESIPQAQLQDKFKDIDLFLPQYNCLRQKIFLSTAEWTSCTARQASADPADAPDAIFRLKSLRPGTGAFQVSTKIVDTIPGNTDRSGLDYLEVGNAVAGRDQVIHPRHIPNLYSMTVQGVRVTDDEREAQEKARLSVLYAY